METGPLRKKLNPLIRCIKCWSSQAHSNLHLVVFSLKKTPFYNGEIIKDLCQKTGIFNLIHQNERHFRNKFGMMIYEDILVLEPNTEVDNTDEIARTVALAHLKDAMNRAPSESQEDLLKAINAVHKVTASPLFINILKSFTFQL